MKYETIGYMNGIELQNPVPENEFEKRELEINEERFVECLVGMIKRYIQSSECGLDKEPEFILDGEFVNL